MFWSEFYLDFPKDVSIGYFTHNMQEYNLLEINNIVTKTLSASAHSPSLSALQGTWCNEGLCISPLPPDIIHQTSNKKCILKIVSYI